jgi:solute carrier family 25 protein 39/40
MSGFWDRPQSSHVATTFETELQRNTASPGQGHDRIHSDDPIPGIPPSMPVSGDDAVEVDITAGQKMLSAMSGSLLTSLLGMIQPLFWLKYKDILLIIAVL